MSLYICLCDAKTPPIQFELFSRESLSTTAEEIIESSKEGLYIISDKSYEAVSIVSDNGLEYSIENVQINDDEVGFDSRISRFKADQPFLDYYGFIRFTIFAKKQNDDEVEVFVTRYISILVKPDRLNANISDMVSYVYDNFRLLLFNDSQGTKARDFNKILEKGFETKIHLVEEISSIYEQSVGYFHINHRFVTKQRYVIDDFEKMRNVTPATLQFLAQNPSHLHECPNSSGIKIGRKSYYPNKTLLQESYYSSDTYENRVVVSFLLTLLTEMQQLRNQLEEVYDSTISISPDNQGYLGYVSSCEFIIEATIDALRASKEKIDSLIARLELLYSQYTSFMQVPKSLLNTSPYPTAVFMSIPKYHLIFTKIHMWLNMDKYNFEREKRMLSFVLVSQLYELYTLTKLLIYAIDSGYELIDFYNYRYNSKPRWISNDVIYNTYVFSKDNHRLTVYYQPVISCDFEENGIELYRNTTISYGGDGFNMQSGSYYTPDFVLKCTSYGKSKYIICDSKYRNINSIKCCLSEYQYKYDFSIDSTNENAEITGICLFSGKELDKEDIVNPKDKERINNPTRKKIFIVPLTETTTKQAHNDNFEYIFSFIER